MKELKESRNTLNKIINLEDHILDRVKNLEKTLLPIKKYIPDSIFEDIKGLKEKF